MEIEQFIVGIWKENTYVLHNKKEALIIDPGEGASDIIQKIKKIGVTPIAILCTHAHFDHVGAVYQLKEVFQIPLYLHSQDKRILRQANLYRKLAGDNSIYKTPEIDHFLDEVTHLKLGGFDIEVVYTPGHSKGSVCFLINGLLFSGDLIFATEVGRTDLPGGNRITLEKSIKSLYQEYFFFKMFPGHGASFFISEIINTNPELKSIVDDLNR